MAAELLAVRDLSLTAGPRLDGVSFDARPGELTAIVGASGSGKSTLIETLAGMRTPDAGSVTGTGETIGYVPQEDIVHRELRLRRMLWYAARLRLPAGAPVGAIVDQTLAALGLTDRAALRVGALSGGERKRASIGVELLTRPALLLLDEPTSGLDPAGAASVVGLLRRLADGGATVVMTTHVLRDLASADKVVVLEHGGRVSFVGTPDEARRHYQPEAWDDLAAPGDAPAPGDPRVGPGGDARVEVAGDPRVAGNARQAARGDARVEVAGEPRGAGDPRVGERGRRIGPLCQTALLARRNLEVLAGSRLTLAIVVASPLMVVAMFLVLFRSGAFDPAHPSPNAALMILFWIAFDAFFFGLTYGLLQIVAELPIVRRERVAGLRLGAYLAAKTAALLPVLAAVDLVMLGALIALDRLPTTNAAQVAITTILASTAALTLGLLASAGVRDASQATVAMPLLCFPQVLFSGAIVPLPQIPLVGKAIALAMGTRWAFEALGHATRLPQLLSHNTPLGPPLLDSYGTSFDRAVAVNWLILAAFALAAGGAAGAVLARRAKGPAR